MNRYTSLRDRRKKRLRFKMSRIAKGKLRLVVNRTNQHMYAQIVDVENGATLAAASTLSKELKGKIKNGGNVEAAGLVGQLIAQKAKEKEISEVVFDRSGFLYHGRVKALAEGARENGLKI